MQDGYAFQTQDAEAWALFGSVDYLPTDRWTLKAGVRFSHEEKDFAAERPDPTFQTPTVAPITADTDDDFTSWDLSATYAVNPDVNVYGRVATSFRAPSIQGRILFCADFAGGTDPASDCVDVAEEEEILSTEVGVKSELLDRRLRLNADRLPLRDGRPADRGGRRRGQHGHPAERRQHRGLRLRGSTPSSPRARDGW